MSDSSTRQMALVGFMQAGNATVYAGSWRHPATEHGFLSAGYYEKLARTLEQGCFDLMFFDDRLAMPGIYGGSVAEAVRTGARPVKLDLSVVLGVCAAVTSRIGLGATYSTTYYTPFHVARTFATLDHLSKGRAAWNVVTSVNDSEAQNYGLKEAIAHDVRYDRADEFLEAATGLWDTWDDDALVFDRQTPLFADPAKVHELTTTGSGSRSAARSPSHAARRAVPSCFRQGRRAAGATFAARWAELIFTGDPDIDIARSHYKDQKEKIGERGRDPDSVKMLPMAYTVVGESAAHAEEREQLFLNELVDPMASLTLLSELMNYDFSGLPLDAPITDELIASVSGIRGLVQNIKTHIGGDTVTLADLAGHRATLLQGPRFVGTGPDIADQMEAWFDGGACDGFVIAATHSPGRLRGCGPPRRPRAPAPRRVPRALQRHDVARASRAGPPRGGRSCLSRVRSPLARHPRRSTRPRLAAGPMVATMLGEFGAEVIKVEQPGIGDPLRTWGEQKDGVGLFWKSMSRNKSCVTMDLRSADGQELFHRLLAVSDVVVVEQPPERAGHVGAGLRVGAPGAPAARDAPHHRLWRRWPEERPARIRHAGRGHERLRPRDRPARRPADAPTVLLGRRRGGAVRDGCRHDGAVPPGSPRRGRPAG